jgi:heat-inducible transcriptional repressor
MPVDDSGLTQRQERILGAVCRDYTVTGSPVSSGGLVKRHGFEWSSATVRQELAVLERQGLVQRSHHSSGRVPTAAGLQRYVQTLPRIAPRPEYVRAVDRGLRDAGRDPEQDLRAASFILSEVAGCVAVSFVGAQRVGTIVDIDVVPLVATRALIVVTMEHGSTLMQPVDLEQLGGEGRDFGAELRRLQERLRWLCRGRTLPAARAELLDRLREEEARFDRILAEALRVGLTVCAGASLDPLLLQVAGQPRLARSEPADGERLGDVLELLADYHRLADVLCQLLPTPGDGAVQVASVQGLTLVGCRLPAHHPSRDAASARTGAVALLGSRRMDYASLIPLVEYAARALATHTEV